MHASFSKVCWTQCERTSQHPLNQLLCLGSQRSKLSPIIGDLHGIIFVGSGAIPEKAQGKLALHGGPCTRGQRGMKLGRLVSFRGVRGGYKEISLVRFKFERPRKECKLTYFQDLADLAMRNVVSPCGEHPNFVQVLL